MLVDLALGRSRRRPPISALAIGPRRDIRAFFGSYAGGCRRADDLLFRAGDAEAVDGACRRSTVDETERLWRAVLAECPGDREPLARLGPPAPMASGG